MNRDPETRVASRDVRPPASPGKTRTKHRGSDQKWISAAVGSMRWRLELLSGNNKLRLSPIVESWNFSSKDQLYRLDCRMVFITRLCHCSAFLSASLVAEMILRPKSLKWKSFLPRLYSRIHEHTERLAGSFPHSSLECFRLFLLWANVGKRESKGE